MSVESISALSGMISADPWWLPGPSQPSAPFVNISFRLVALALVLEGKEDVATTTSTAAFAS